jgi:hypothetical protein
MQSIGNEGFEGFRIVLQVFVVRNVAQSTRVETGGNVR